METTSLNCTKPCVKITPGVFNVNSPTLDITNLSESSIFILNGQNENFIYELLTGETANIKSTYFKTGIVTFRYDANSDENQICINVNPYVNIYGEDAFEVVDCGSTLPSTTITGQTKTGVDIVSSNLFQDTTWVINIEIDNYKTSSGYLIPVTSIDSSLGNNVVFDFYYNGTYGVNSPDTSFTLTKENPSISSSVNNFIYMSGSGATSLVMVVSGATGAKWTTNITTSYNSSTIQYTYIFDQSNPGKFDLFVKQNPFAGIQKKLGGISDNQPTYSSEFRTGPNTHIVIDSSLNGGDTNLFNSSSPLLTNNGFSKNYILSGVSINTITQFTDKFLVGGDFNLYNGTEVNSLVKLNKNGTLDPTFFTNQPFTGSVNTILNFYDNSIFVGGEFNVNQNNISSNNIIKLNINGEIDSFFIKNSQSGLNGPVNIIKKYTNDTVIIGGKFSEYRGKTSRGIIILNQDGTIRSDFKGGFNITGDTPNVRDIHVFDDGSLIVIGGDDDSNSWITTFQNVAIPTNIVKITPNGYVDAKFSATTGLDGSAYSIIMDCTGKLIVGGGFDCYEDTNGNHCGLESLLKIDSNGICDTTYSNDLNLNGEVKALSSFASPNYEKLSGGGNSFCNCGRWVPVTMEGGFIPIYWKFTCDCATNKPCKCPETISCEEKTMFVGGNFTDPANGFVKVDNGSDIVLYDFITCDGVTGYTYAPSNITNGTVILANVNETSVVCGTVGNEVVSGDTNIYYSDGKITYSDCGKCYAEYQVKLLVREPGKQDVVFLKTMTKAQIDKVTQFGPIFATGGPETYEILDYWLGSTTTTKGIVSFVEITPTPTLTPTKTKTPTPTKTKTPTRTTTKTKTPTPTVTKTKTPTATPGYVAPSSTPTKTVTKTPNVTPTVSFTPGCCKTCYLFNGTASSMVYNVTKCDNTTVNVSVPIYSTATTCCISASFVSGSTNYYPNPTGITYSNDCSCSNLTPTPTPTKTKTPTKTPTRTPTKTRTPSVTPTKTKTPTPSTTPSVISFIDSFGYVNNVKSLVVDTTNNKYYSTTTGGTDVYNSLYIREQSITGVTADTTAVFAISIFDTNNNKLYFGNPESTTILSYDTVSSAQTSINISPKVTFNMTFDYDNNLLGVLDGDVTPTVTVIDTTTDSVNGTITGLTTGYKGDIAYNGGYAYVVGSAANVCEVDLVNLVTASTFSISGGIQNDRKIIYNPNNGRFYVLTPGDIVSVVTSASEQSTIDISSYTGVSQTMTFNPDKNYLYVGNVDGDGILSVITIDCASNTVVNFTNNLRTGFDPDTAKIYYDGISSELLVINLSSPDIYRFTT